MTLNYSIIERITVCFIILGKVDSTAYKYKKDIDLYKKGPSIKYVGGEGGLGPCVRIAHKGRGSKCCCVST